MKKRLLIIAAIVVVVVLANVINPNKKPALTASITDTASFKYQNAWYWIIQFDSISTKKDVLDYVKQWANPNSTSWFFAYPDSLDLSMFNSKNLAFPVFANTIVHGVHKPSYGFYKMPNNDTIYDDATWVLEMATE